MSSDEFRNIALFAMPPFKALCEGQKVAKVRSIQVSTAAFTI
jgi:hypothetical protein